MPIGTSKVGLFGGKPVVLAGCETFNAPGTFTAVAGLEIVTVVGSGGAGNPGNPGNPSTFNCVAVSAGCYPVQVGTGGQIIISWNDQ